MLLEFIFFQIGAGFSGLIFSHRFGVHFWYQTKVNLGIYRGLCWSTQGTGIGFPSLQILCAWPKYLENVLVPVREGNEVRVIVPGSGLADSSVRAVSLVNATWGCWKRFLSCEAWIFLIQWQLQIGVFRFFLFLIRLNLWLRFLGFIGIYQKHWTLFITHADS